METYLMMLYVSLEQETALKNFFIDQGWAFCKPDLSITTSKLGPTRGSVRMSIIDPESALSVTNKRKANAVSQGAPKVKLAKVLTGTTAAENRSETSEYRLERSSEKHNKDSNEIANQNMEDLNIPVTCTVDIEEEDDVLKNTIIKIEKNSADIEEDSDYAENEDVGDGDNDDTDVDDSMEIIDEDIGENVDELNMNTKVKGIEDSGHRKKDVMQETTDEECENLDDGDTCRSKVVPLHRKTVFTCEVCGRRYLSKPTLQRHLKKHSSPYYCRSCSMAFQNSEDLEQHKGEKHNQLYFCPQCDKYFKRKNSLWVHMESVHKGIQRFPCMWPDCEKSFFRQDVLNDHINTHTGERPYTCQKCDKSYTSKSGLNHHWKACKTDGLPCNICGQILSSRSGLADHVQGMHDKKPLPCVCGQVFTWRNNLLKHKKTCLEFINRTDLNNTF